MEKNLHALVLHPMFVNNTSYVTVHLQYTFCNIPTKQINTVVSGALDRLHSEKDPCVKYDVNSKLWIYLHRSRTEEEFGESLLFVVSFL